MSNNENEEERKDQEDDQPKIFGDYEVLKPIGRGKFAVVYRARRISDDKIVALKRINVDMIDEKARDKCLKEVRLLQSLDHPNIIKYYDSFINENDLVIIVEWAAAGDLKRQLRKAQEKQIPFEERIIWKYFSQIADAIQHMHERRIMHRDLKPANILLTLDGTVKVGDLGLSRELSENTYQAHSKVGTPLYMSPEVLRGDGYDFKSDIWSIGCLLYELAMLKSPFKAEGLNMFSLFQKISQGEYSPLPDRYSDELKSLAYAMISTSSTDRPEIGDICEISRKMRIKYNEEYNREKKLKTTQSNPNPPETSPNGNVSKNQQQEDSKAQGTNPTKSMPERGNSNSYRSIKRNEDERIENNHESDGENGEEDDYRQDVRKKPIMQQNTRTIPESKVQQMEETAQKTSSRGPPSSRVNGNHPKPSFGGDSDEDSDATQDLKSTTKAAIKAKSGNGFREETLPQQNFRTKPQPEEDRLNRPDKGRVEDRQNEKRNQKERDDDDDNIHQRNDPRSRQTEPLDQKKRNILGQKPNFPVRSNEKGEVENHYIPYTNSNHDSTSSKSASNQLNQPSHRRIKETKQRVSEPEQDDFLSDFPVTRVDTVSKNSSLLENVGGTMAAMEMVYSKLLALNYPFYLDSSIPSPKQPRSASQPGNNQQYRTQCRLSPLHFVHDLSTLYGNKKKAIFPSTQFGTFVEVCFWLVEQTFPTPFVPSVDIDHDPPPVIVKYLLKVAQDCGISATILADLTPNSLVSGYGEKVCQLLNLLADVALKNRKHSWNQFVYPVETLDNFQPQGDQADPDDDMVLEEDLGDVAIENFVDVEGSADILMSHQLQMSLILPTTDSSQWKEETERVSAALKSSLKEKLRGSTDYISHLETLKAYSTRASDGDSQSDKLSREDIDISTISIVEMVSILQRSILEGLSGIARGESMVNSNGNLHNLSTQYAEIHEKMKVLEGRLDSCTKNVTSNSNRLSEVQDLLQEVVEELEAKTGESGDNEGGNSMIMNMKRAIKSLKEENRDMHLRSSLIQAELLGIRKMVTTEKRKKQETTRKNKNKSRNERKQNQNQFDESLG